MVKPGGTGSPRLAISARFAPFAAQQVFHVRLALGLAVAEGVNPLRHHSRPGGGQFPRTSLAVLNVLST
jgi:hypothetical protein